MSWLLLILGSQRVLAVRFSLPSNLPGQLVFQNPSNQPQDVYQKFAWDADPSKFDGAWEKSFTVKAQGSLYREIATLVQPLQFDSNFKDLKVYYRGVDGRLIAISGGQATNLEVGPMRGGGSTVISITNFSSMPQSGELTTKSLTGRKGQKLNFQLKGYQTIELKIELTAGTWVQLRGEYVLGAYLKNNSGTEIFSGKIRKFLKTDQAGRLFLLANEDRTQSYVVRLTDEKLIQAARDQILNPTGWRARILIGEVSKNSNRDNQNLLSSHQPMWSWHISKVHRFAELASQSCDGSPQFIEDVLPAWVAGLFNGGSTTTCFWGYQIVQEL